jgi:hypothetical protein
MEGKSSEAKMVICPQCNIEHEAGEEFCRRCGKFLLMVDEPIPEVEKTEVKLLCPKCQVFYKKGTYCRKCGSLLSHRAPSQETDIQPLGKKSIKRRSKEWLNLFKEKKELEICLKNLETQQDKVSMDVFTSIYTRYQGRLESLAPPFQEIGMELESVRRRASEGINLIEKELKPLHKKLEELQSLYKSGAITKADFFKEKKGLGKEIKSKEKNIKTHRQFLSLLPDKIEKRIVSPRPTKDLLRSPPLFISIAIFILIGAGGYFLWSHPSQSLRAMEKEIPVSPVNQPPQPLPQSIMEVQEVGKIKSIFDNIKQANAQMDISLFMSCFSRDFNEIERKRLNALKMWEDFNYLRLSYDLKKQRISGDKANVTLEWIIRASPKAGGPLQDTRTLLDVTLKKEEGRWKIKEIKPVR